MADLGLLSDEKKVSADFRRLTTKEFREGLSEVIAFSTRTKQPLVLTRHGKDQAALVSINDLWIIEALEKIQLRTALDDCESPEMVLSKLREMVDEHLGRAEDTHRLTQTQGADHGGQTRKRQPSKSQRRGSRSHKEHSESSGGL